MDALPTPSQSGPTAKILWLSLAALLFLAYANDWQYDEAVSYTCVEALSIWDIVAYTKFKTANHQVLNSLFFRSIQPLGLKEAFFYRLLSITGFLMFFRANARILSMYRISPWYILPLILGPYFYYFTQGRGYSLALGSFALSLLYLLRYRQTRLPGHAYAMLLFGCLSATSIFSFFFAVAAVFLAYAVTQLRRGIDRHLLMMSAGFLLLTLYIRYGGATVQANDPWIIGTNSLFKNGSLSSVLSDFSQFRLLGELPFYPYVKALIALCIGLPILAALGGYRSGWRERLRRLSEDRSLPLLLIAVSLSLMAVAHVVMKAMYPLNRAAFFIHYLLLLYILIARHDYRDSWPAFRLPLLVLFLSGCLLVADIYANLLKPGNRRHLEMAGDSPLYILSTGYNPNVRLTNRLASIDKTDIHQVSKDVRVMDSLIRADTSARVFLLTHTDFIDSLRFDKRKVHEGRDDHVLFEIERPH
jgi:hypothetical protein